MSHQTPLPASRITTTRIVIIYALFGLAWIYGSDTVLGWLVHDPGVMVKLAVVKGSLFILCTATLLYFLINRFAQQLARVERARLENLKNYQAIFNATNEAIFIHDSHTGQIIDINARVLDIFGYRRDEALSLDIDQLSEGITPYSQAEAAANIQRAKFEGPQVFEWLCRKKSGELFWTEVSLRKLTIDDYDRVVAVVRDISDRKQSEEALRASEINFRNLYENIMDGFVMVDMNGVLTKWNKPFEEILGYSGKELAKLDFMSITPVKWHLLEENIIQEQVITKGYSSVYEKEYIRKDGTILPVELRAYLIKDEKGNASGMWAYVRDITERKLSEREREVAHERFKAVMDSIDALVYVADMDTYEILFINEYGKSLFGDIEGEKCWHTLQNSQPGPCEFCTNNRLILENGQPAEVYVWEFQNTVNGKWYQCRDKAIRWHDNRLVRMEIATDISDRKQMELALSKSKEHYRLLTESVSAIPWEFNIPQNRWTYVGPQAEKVLGYAPEEWTDLEWWLALIHPADKTWVPDYCRAMTAKGEEHSMVYRLIAKNGNAIWVNDFVSIEMQAGEPVIMRGIMVNVTEQKQSEEEKSRLEAQLQQAQKIESIGRLAGGVAHDFNNMLTVIIGQAELALLKLEPDNPLAANFIEIRKTAERSADLTRQLLAFARRQTISPKELELNKTIASMLSLLQRLIGEDIKLKWRPAADLWKILMDSSQIDQILANLCVNARDAIEDTGTITIETANRQIDALFCSAHPEAVPGDYVQLSVSDNGIGMGKETLTHIFEPFFTTKELGKGTGLGLATVYGIVKQNNGFIIIDSEPGQGTTFSIYFHRHQGKNIKLQFEEDLGKSPRGQETVIVAEDDPAILEIIKIMLSEQGYRVLAASTPGEAIHLARENIGEIHLLITDVIMPEMNGRELAKNILALHPGMKRLFMSGYTADVIAHHGVLDDGVHFIQKPFLLPNMTTKVREVLDSN